MNFFVGGISMNDNRLLNELVENRVEKRLAQGKRFGAHLIGGVLLSLLTIVAASQEWLPGIVIFLLIMGVLLSLTVHGLWLALNSARETVTQEESARVKQMYPELAGLSLEAEKPKRTGSALAEDLGETLGEDIAEEPIDLDMLAAEEERRRRN